MTGRWRIGVIAAAATLLATAPLSAIFDSWTWLFQATVVVGAVAAAAAAGRALRLPAPLGPVATAAGLLLALTWLFPSGQEFLLLLPTPDTLARFGDLLAGTPAALAAHAVPVADDPSLLFVSALGIGLVAVVVDTCAVGMRQPALAGLPMLAIYSVPVAVRSDGVAILPFLIGAIGYLWLLAADNLDRVRRFGRRFAGDGSAIPAWQPSPLAAVGRRLAVVGLAVAVAVPLAAPGMTGLIDRWDPALPGGGAGAGSGTGEVNLFAELSGQLNQDATHELLRVTTDDPDPFYLRFATASEITSTGFIPRPPQGSPVTGALPPRQGSSGPTYRHTATMELTEQYQLAMAPSYAELAEVNGLDPQWLYDPDQQIVFSNRIRATGIAYSVSYHRSDFSAEALRSARPLPENHPRRIDTEAPPVPEVVDLVAELTADADTAYDQVLALFTHFSVDNGFRYSLQTGPETTGVAIVDFLENKEGYCVQYAAALAWLVRTAGIPARVAFGFTRGSNYLDDTYVLTNRNMHAWTEVYFPGFGWVPFDATPTTAIAGGVDPDWAPDPDGSDPERDTPSPADEPTEAPTDHADAPTESPDFAEDGAISGTASADGSSPLPGLAVIGLLLAAALLAAPGVSRLRLRRRRCLPPADLPARQRAHAAWAELLDTMIDYDLPPDPTETPRGTVARLVRHARLTGAEAEAAGRLGAAEEQAQYAPAPPAPGHPGADLRLVRLALAQPAGRSTRARAILLPPSTRRRWRDQLAASAGRIRQLLTEGGLLLGRMSPRRLLPAGREK